ncbi:TIGR03621 family F420-dependent LLM class oxidoreductase [Nocardia flavorosea]|uniref:TIGR03621 family F420-dependent LLM class oxidoreductase n=1 Tax=Nocardia flavorosea TaxID=53429 RepID=UPI0018962ED3|nr:TIGR03621 family F420-dependent LLM class oxidoreductase [Nocardia flavorosea]MBF6348320.1 TIGR03621 family F420-dependent LLM class oxidoreductase [Nocardia flavorosea]
MSSPTDFRFGVNMVVPHSRDEWVHKCRRAEQLGYDVIGVADHLGMAPPFPALVLAAENTERVRLNTFVLNVPFYNPVLLAREVAGTDRFVQGRLELGLGAGYVRAEFDTAGIPFGSGASRVEYVEQTVRTLRDLFADPGFGPQPARPGGPPLLIGGWGDRMLTLAARYASVVALTGAAATTAGGLRLAGPAEIDERVGFVRAALGERAAEVELNILVQSVVPAGKRAEFLDRYASAVAPEVLAAVDELPTVLLGGPREIADRLRANRERFGFGYITVLEPDMDTFAPVIAEFR